MFSMYVSTVSPDDNTRTSKSSIRAHGLGFEDTDVGGFSPELESELASELSQVPELQRGLRLGLLENKWHWSIVNGIQGSSSDGASLKKRILTIAEKK